MKEAEKETKKQSDHLKDLRNYLRKLKKESKKKNASPNILRAIIRVKALIAYYKGRTIREIAQCYDVSEKSLRRWIKRYESQGCENLHDEERSGRPSKLPQETREELKKMIETQNQRVWVARHVYVTILMVFGVAYSVKYIPELLRSMGLSFRKAVCYLIRKDSEKRRKWIQEKLPEIYKDKIAQGWRIFYQDEMGVQTEGTLARTWGEKGKSTEIENFGRHGRVNIIGAFELGTGKFYGVITSFRVNATRFRRFICHLKREMKTDKILLICDNASFHKAKWLTQWVETNKDWLRLEFLPAYSPDFNPIERLWRWMKTEFTHNKCWKTKQELKKYMKDVMRQIPSHTESIKTLMKKENERFKEIQEYYETDYIEQFALPV